MKAYRLLAWPELRGEFRRIAYQRALTEMSQRWVGLARLVEVSGLRRSEVHALLAALDARAALDVRATAARDSLFDTLDPIGWLRRAIQPKDARR